MRHVVVMTLTGSLGLVFMFLVDVTTLFWVSYLGDEGLDSCAWLWLDNSIFYHFKWYRIDGC
jgi:hypothetical protein